jgi:hypothetical protein
MRALLLALLTTAVAFAGCASDSQPDDAVIDPIPPEPEVLTATWGLEADALLRPGAPIGWCTYNFLWFNPENGTHYVGTAAHCTELGERMPLVGYGEIGTTVFDSDESPGADAGIDFALILLDGGVNLLAHPKMVEHDGPKGYVEAADVARGDELEHHGYGMVFGSLEPTRSRPGVLLAFDDDYCSQSVVWWGDSGSPVLHADSQKALGIVSRAGWFECATDGAPGSQLRGATIGYILRETAAAGWPIELATV